MPEARIDIKESGMSVGGMERLERLINEFDYKETTVLETRYGHVFLGERYVEHQPNSSLWQPGYLTFWAARDLIQEVYAPINMSRRSRQQEAIDAAMRQLKERNDIYREL